MLLIYKAFLMKGFFVTFIVPYIVELQTIHQLSRSRYRPGDRDYPPKKQTPLNSCKVKRVHNFGVALKTGSIDQGKAMKILSAIAVLIMLFAASLQAQTNADSCVQCAINAVAYIDANGGTTFTKSCGGTGGSFEMSYERATTAACTNAPKVIAGVSDSPGGICYCDLTDCGGTTTRNAVQVSESEKAQARKDLRMLCNEAGTVPNCP